MVYKCEAQRSSCKAGGVGKVVSPTEGNFSFLPIIKVKVPLSCMRLFGSANLSNMPACSMFSEGCCGIAKIRKVKPIRIEICTSKNVCSIQLGAGH